MSVSSLPRNDRFVIAFTRVIRESASNTFALA